MRNSLYQIDLDRDIQLEDYSGAIKATGFQAPGDEFASGGLNLHEYFVKDQAATYFMVMDSTEWIKSGIYLNDVLIVDAGKIELVQNRLYVCTVDGMMCLRRCRKLSSGVILHVDHTSKFTKLSDADEVSIFGSVIGVARKFKPNASS